MRSRSLRRTICIGAIGLAAFLGGLGVAALATGGAVEGTAYSNTVPLAGFYSCPCGIEGVYGDGTTTDLSSPGPFTWTSVHTYTAAGVYTYGLTVTSCQADIGCGAGVTAKTSGTLTVADAPLTGTGGPAIAVPQGTAFSGALGHFADTDPAAHPASFYTATVNWGDGSTSPGTITAAAGGGFNVTGAHTWTTAGAFTVHVTVADHVGIGVTPSSIVLASSATVASTSIGDPPHAVIGSFAQPVVGGHPLNLSAGASTGTGPLTYTWTFCTSSTHAVACAPGSPTASGATITHAFPYAPVHDPKLLGRGVDPVLRRSSTLLVLTVSDSHGRSDTATQPITIVPDLPPKPGFAINPKALVGQDTVSLSAQAFDPNHNDAIVEEDWDLTGDGYPELICKAFAGCTVQDPRLAGALTQGPGITNLAARLAHSRAKVAAKSAATKKPISSNVSSATLPVSKSDQLAFQQGQLNLSTLAFPTFHWNFAAAALDASNLAPLSTIDLSGLGDPARAQFLQDLAYLEYWETPVQGLGYKHRPIAAINDSKYVTPSIVYPHQISLTAIDAEGETATSTLDVAIAIDKGPTARISQIPDPVKPVPQAGDTIKLNTQGVHGTDGPIAWYQLDASPNQPADSTKNSQYCMHEPVGATGLSPGTNGKYNSYNPYTGEPNDPDPNGSSKTKPPNFHPKPKTSTDTTPPPPPTLAAGLPAQRSVADLLAGKFIERLCTHNDNRSVFGPGTITLTSKNLADVDHIVLPTAGDWEVGLTAYDQLGVSSRRILFPIHVEEAAADCAPLSHEKVFAGAKVSFGLSGDCFTHRGSVYVASKPVDLDGLALAPAPGASLVFVDRKDGQGRVFATTTALPDPVPASLDSWASGAAAKSAGASLRLGQDTVGAWSTFKQTDLATLVNGDEHQITVPPDAQYRTLLVAPQTLTAQITSYGNSEVKLRTLLPEAFGGGDTEGSVDITASNVPTESTPAALDPNRPARSVHRGSVTAHTADDADEMPVPDGSSLGPIPLPDNFAFEYDAGTQTWKAGLHGISLPGLPGSASLDLVVKGSTLVSATGSLSVPGGIPIAPGVVLTNLSFTIDTSPFTISAAAGVTIGEIVQGTGRLTVTPDPLDVRVDANLRLLDFLPLGGGYVEFTNGTLSFAGSASYDFGPASLAASVSGGINLTTKDFYIFGSGKACLFVCVGAQAIVSSVGVAACGEVDLYLTSLEIGVGYRWDGDLSVWLDSCGLDSFKVALSRAAPAARALSPKATLPAGSSEQVNVPKNLKAFALRVTGPKGSTVVPQVQLVGPKGDARVVGNPATLGDYAYGLDGGSTPLARTASAPSAGGPTGSTAINRAGSTLSEENPLDGTTTLIVAKPKAGLWTLKVRPGSVPVTLVNTAGTLDVKAVSPSDLKLLAGAGSGKENVIGSRFTTISKGKATIASAGAKPVAHVLASELPKLERARVRRLTYKVDATQGAVTLVDDGPSGTAVLTKAAAGAKRTGTVAFDPAGGGKHTIRAITLDAHGMPISVKVVKTYTAPPLPKPGPPGISKLVRQGRNTLLVLAHGPSDPAPDAIAYYVRLHADGGLAQGFIVLGKQVHQYHGHPAIVLRHIPAGRKIRVRVRSAFGGLVSAASKHG